MPRVTVKFGQSWPLMGKVRGKGEILLDGVSPIPGVTPDKIVNAIKNNAVIFEISPDTERKTYNEAANDSAGIGSLLARRSRRNKKS